MLPEADNVILKKLADQKWDMVTKLVLGLTCQYTTLAPAPPALLPKCTHQGEDHLRPRQTQGKPLERSAKKKQKGQPASDLIDGLFAG